jgi:putative transcriptional regulator
MAKRRTLKKEDKQLANRIRTLRQARGMTQEELSARLGLSLTYIAHMETHRRGLSLPVLYRIARIFGVPVRDLFLF